MEFRVALEVTLIDSTLIIIFRSITGLFSYTLSFSSLRRKQSKGVNFGDSCKYFIIYSLIIIRKCWVKPCCWNQRFNLDIRKCIENITHRARSKSRKALKHHHFGSVIVRKFANKIYLIWVVFFRFHEPPNLTSRRSMV